MPINRMIVIGFFLVLLGAALPFLMVLGVIESTLFLNFLAFASSVAGIFLGVVGMATHVGKNRRPDDWFDS